MESQEVATEVTESSQEEQLFETYIATPNKFDWYRRSFEKYTDPETGKPRFKLVFSFWGMIGGIFFLLYRKVYLWAFILFLILVFSPDHWLMSLVILFITATITPYLVYKKYRSALEESKTNAGDDFDKRLEIIRRIGGVHEWAVWLGAFIYIIVIAFYLYFIFLVAIFSGYNGG